MTDVPTTDRPTPDPLLAGLRDLAEPAPATLADRVVDGWVRAPSPLGEVYAVAGAGGVRLVRTAAHAGDLEVFLEDYRTRHGRPVRPATRPPRGLLPALRGSGGPPELDLTDVGDFARKVLAATARIPAGQIRPYGWVAREAGHPTAVRAVGTALARNPVPLLIPCHRVVRGDGGLGQYLSGAGDKATLLAGEGPGPRPGRRPRRRGHPPDRQRHHRRRLLPVVPPRAPDHRRPPPRVREPRPGPRRRLPPLPRLPPLAPPM